MRFVLAGLVLLACAGCENVNPWTRPAPVRAMPGPNAAGAAQPYEDPGIRPLNRPLTPR